MLKLLFLAALLCGLAAAQTVTPAANLARPATHPIVGVWSWTLPGKPCEETWQYRVNGTRLGSSGDEVVQGDYEVTPVPGASGFYRLVETVTQANGKRDCPGDLHQASGERITRFIQFSPKLDQLIVCKAESLQACFGPLKRVP